MILFAYDRRSLDQPWHGDGPHLFGRSLQCPIHAVNVFIPLCDVTEDIGPTEFIPGSNILANALSHNATGKNDKSISSYVRPTFKAGSVLLYDYRTIHRGTRNVSKIVRPMLYLLYAKPWFRDYTNFGEVSLFSESTIVTRSSFKVSFLRNEDQECAGFCSLDDM